MEINKKKIYISLLFLVVVIFASQYFAKERGKRNFRDFDKAEINNILKSDSYTYDKGASISLLNGMDYIFYPHTDSKLNDNKIFNQTAKKGDRVIKESYGDTLFLYKDDRVLKYTFIKFD